MKSVLTLAETADHFSVCTRTVVRTFVGELGLKAMKLPGGWRFRAEDIDAFERALTKTHTAEEH